MEFNLFETNAQIDVLVLIHVHMCELVSVHGLQVLFYTPELYYENFITNPDNAKYALLYFY